MYVKVVSVSDELQDLLKGLSRQYVENASELLLGIPDKMWQKGETLKKTGLNAKDSQFISFLKQTFLILTSLNGQWL